MMHTLIPAIPAENYIVCGQVGMTEVVPGSVKEKCFSCRRDVVIFPNSQRLLTERAELHLKIVCSSCYMAAPDKDHVKPLAQSGAPQNMVDMLRKRSK